jgi:probable F420-dependent oxidoreductase
MKVGLIPVNIGVPNADAMVQMAQTAEAAGFESVWTFEHVIVPVDYKSKYPYSPTGKMGAAPETNFVDPLIALTAGAAQTKKVRLGTGVNILSQTNPLLLAKQAASLDFVSNGRFMLGVGIGWLQEEFVAMGTPFERRGARFDDYVVAMKKVWSGNVVEHDSAFLNWHGFKSYPVPIQKPHVPIIIGGDKGKIYERIAKVGDGWYVPGGDPAVIAKQLAELKSVCQSVGRNAREIEITTMWQPQSGIDVIKKLAEIGVARVTVVAMGGTDPLGSIKRLGDEVIAKVR